MILPISLPHGPDFRLIEGFCSVDAVEKTAHANFPYSGNEKLDLADHFPGSTIFPGALLLEAMAQTAIQTAQLLPEMQGRNYFFAGVENARFRQMIPAPATISLEAKIVSFKMGIGKAECKAKVHGKVVGEAIITFAISRN